MKIYLCKQSDAPMFGDQEMIVKAFLHEEHAKKYCEIAEAQEEPYTYSFYVEPIEVMESFDMSLKVRDYYCFVCDTECSTIQDIESSWHNDEQEIYRKVGDDTFIEIQDWGDGTYHIESYSINSFQEAKDLAIQKWKELKK